MPFDLIAVTLPKTYGVRHRSQHTFHPDCLQVPGSVKSTVITRPVIKKRAPDELNDNSDDEIYAALRASEQQSTETTVLPIGFSILVLYTHLMQS
jgi:hypothetical protein